MSVLKLAGKMMEDMGGVLQLYPINGKTGGAGGGVMIYNTFSY